ncbi:hypothetical protein L873DRAFT_1843571 [Choiromyces venosus 120613-1]|uniref:Uncharacterized protein n=1 Tax=Choiromyces venosus 120613-1 TaxID=1336337 RepID=A0A3N4JMJ0_9PEZI|nr:hypothetical protein L873DRAFT_1843571 [Choiromyces venosus 120613-1]
MGPANGVPSAQSRPHAVSTVSLHSTTNVDITYRSPPVPLPLDLLAYLQSVATSSTHYFRSLKNFDSLASTLAFYIGLLPPDVSLNEKAQTETEELDQKWIKQATDWAAKILRILDEMQTCLEMLQKNKPDDLKGNYHPLEEWEGEVVAAAKALKLVAARFETEVKGKNKVTRSGARVTKVLEQVKSIRILNLK